MKHVGMGVELMRGTEDGPTTEKAAHSFRPQPALSRLSFRARLWKRYEITDDINTLRILWKTRSRVEKFVSEARSY